MELFGRGNAEEKIYAEGCASFAAGDFVQAYGRLFGLANRGHEGAQFCIGVMYHMGIPWEQPYQDYQQALDFLQRSAQQGCQEAEDYLARYFQIPSTPPAPPKPRLLENDLVKQKPASEPEAAQTATGPETMQPVAEPEMTPPVAEPEIAQPEPEPEVTQPEPEPEMPPFVAEPEITQPASEPEVTQPEPEPEIPQPAPKPEISAYGREMYDKGMSSYAREDYPMAAYCFGQAAQEGMEEAQIMLGTCYEQGLGVDANSEYAAYWFGQAAAKGNATGQLCLGILYLHGNGVPQDMEVGRQWIQLSADQGNENALELLEEMDRPQPEEEEEDEDELVCTVPKIDRVYMSKSAIQFIQEHTEDEIIGTGKNAASTGMNEFKEGKEEDAFESFKIGAQLGNPVAQYFLGLMYKNGHYVKEDPIVAKEWLQRSAAQGFDIAKKELEDMRHVKVPTAEEWAQMAKELQGEDAQGEKLLYLKKAADRGHLDSLLFLGLMLTLEPSKNVPMGLDYLEWAVELGSAEAMGVLGEVYSKGEVVKKDMEKAMYYWKKGAELGDGGAQVHLGNAYIDPENTDMDMEKAFYWFSKAAANGKVGGKRGMGVLYALGAGVEQDKQKGKQLLQEAIREGDEAAKAMYKELF